uniref:cysteine--tRNA ligase n=1 Tax=Timema tahoe TaxID=61484 RepID=A0A7R9FFS1_9NEOP|nr:unnamed protein product [Timema tahoe]
MYLLLCECSNFMENLSAAAMLLPALRARLKQNKHSEEPKRVEYSQEVVLRISHSLLMSFERMKPKSRDWAGGGISFHCLNIGGFLEGKDVGALSPSPPTSEAKRKELHDNRTRDSWLSMPTSEYPGFVSYSGSFFTDILSRKWQCASVRTQSSAKWILPSGHDTNIYVYNCITKKKVPLILRNPNYASWYMCGPTVYDSAHIGHAWYVYCSSKFSMYNCYMKFDIIRRILCNHFNINVIMVMGITDIDDKIIHRASELGEDINTLTRRFEAEFHEDMAKLNIKPATIITRVTDFVPRIISFVQEIVDKGNGYVTVDGSVYFDTSQFDRYGKLFPVSMDEEPAQPMVDKKSPLDFALWKGAKPNEPSWLSPWGSGRPGWHIECSTMASAMFGRTMDLHSGGVDLLFPHHENEEAQSCVHHGVSQWVNYWLHSGHLHLKGDTKMSKSLKNTISIRDFLTKFTANEFRVFCLLSRYRNG